MKVFERFDGSRIVQEKETLTGNPNVVLIPRRDGTTWEIIDYMRFDKTDESVDGNPLFKQSEEPIDITLGDSDKKYKVRIATRESLPATHTLNAKSV